ncbi:class I lanthipeptide [Taibaiella koreensis]|uniref:class I lanthipeptide n=1 Tax=Taibaiella koreensis TaxID=1268548 RepID=UPI0013C370DC|nr:class I lanthipeptide [Taibaiella koreensis]
MKKTKLALGPKLAIRKQRLTLLATETQHEVVGGATQIVTCQQACLITRSCAPAICETTACPPTN